MDGPEPVDVETTPGALDAAAGRSLRAAGDRPVVGDRELHGRTAGVDDRFSSERGKLVTTGVVVGAIALLLGWVLGRLDADGDGDDLADAVDDPSSSSVVEPSIPLPIAGEPIGPVISEDGSAETPATRPESGTVVVPRAPAIGPIDIDARLLGSPLNIVGVDFSGTLYEIDLRAAERTDYLVERIPVDPTSLVAGDDWILVDSIEPSSLTIIWSDGSRSTIDRTAFWRVLAVEGTDLVWTLVEEPGGIAAFQRIDVKGGPPAGVVSPAPTGWPVAVDPRTGGLIVQTQGRVYSVLPDDSTYIGTGEAIAVSADEVLLEDCDEHFVCGLRLVTRSTGEEVSVPDSSSTEWQPVLGIGAAPISFSPDGRWAPAIRVGEIGSDFGFVDVGTGAFVSLATNPYPPFAVWTPDGRYVIYLDAEHVLSARDVDTGETFAVLGETVQWRSAATRPVSGPADDAVEG